jgi:ABC-type Mn2+/Zn2+ transport system permease subunit
MQFRVGFPVGSHRVTGVFGVFVVRRRIEFLSHGVPPLLK